MEDINLEQLESAIYGLRETLKNIKKQDGDSAIRKSILEELKYFKKEIEKNKETNLEETDNEKQFRIIKGELLKIIEKINNKNK